MTEVMEESEINLQGTFDLAELPEFCDTTKKEEAEKLVKTFISRVTCVFMGDGLRGQTQAIQDIRDAILRLIQEIGLKPEDFRVNCEDIPNEPPMWSGINEAANTAISSAAVNERFWA